LPEALTSPYADASRLADKSSLEEKDGKTDIAFRYFAIPVLGVVTTFPPMRSRDDRLVSVQ